VASTSENPNVPQRHEHLKRAQENEKLAHALKKLRTPSGVDWAITVLFYSALHYVDAFLAGKNCHPLTHEDRNDEIEANGSLAEIANDCRRLEDLSREARYNIAEYPPEKFAIARARFERIKDHVTSLM
jgi:uncharacterized protein (UPF0332 family)